MKKVIIYSIAIIILLYLFVIFGVSFLMKLGYTKSDSDTVVLSTNTIDIPASNRQIHKYIEENPEDSEAIAKAYEYLNGTESDNDGWFPKNITDNAGFMFILNGIENRKQFVSEVRKQSELLGLDYDLVMSAVLGEQIRIATKGARGDLKNIILNGTPTLLRGRLYDVSLGIGGIKVSTAYQIKRDALHYGYGTGLRNDIPTAQQLTENDTYNAKYATYLVKNIVHRWALSGYDISRNPGVVGTLYNMGNSKEKAPHGNPQIGGSVIKIGGKDYVYGGISMSVYWYLKIYK